jgi:S1-C subfamily serine protease
LVRKLIASIVTVIIFTSCATAASPVGTKLNLRKLVGPSVVMIRGEQGGGTGSQIELPSGNKYIVTNDHVCELKDSQGMLYIKTQGTDQWIKREVLEQSGTTDLCLVRGIEGLPALSLAENGPEIGDEVYAYGHPLLQPLTGTRGEYIERIRIEVLNYVIMDQADADACNKPKNKIDQIDDFFLGKMPVCLSEVDSESTTMIIYPGNSGSPMVNDRGQVIGIVFAGSNETHWGYAVPLYAIKDFLKGK